MSPRPWILVTGGAGYVAHAVVEALLARNLDVVVLDDLSTGHADAVPPRARLVVGDVRNTRRLLDLLDTPGHAGTFHFAGRTQVAESVREPLAYYTVNVSGSLALLEALARKAPDRPLIFSSSAGVYGAPDTVPVPEDAPLRPMSPYGDSKRTVEAVLAACHKAWGLPYMALRYFNAAGATPGGSERHDPESHLIPNLLRAAAGGPAVTLFGTDYATPDGTAVRDYIHVLDLAAGHLAALDTLAAGGPSGCVNLGSGRGTSVREVLAAAERIVGHPIPHVFADRRPGDPPVLVADIRRARQVLHFVPERSSIEAIVSDAWAFGTFPHP